ncbi:acyltransferase family protein [Jiangella rhizosphaerae]|uniref:Acyltransferase n=1 Tax=Jiangella rhizosphaerae TaxID=2293569 RepID=A0A418KMI1_9ACTN|nr:acyltransferase family protein [Jiangella rhizosphaerae]RIQ19610.1 acyltransferase [Jiangella rhizosphaerae]
MTATVTEAPRATTKTAAPSGFRPEIQGLRAVAVLLVVIFHLWPEVLSGGFVGVDVFFVISGYLITAHIHREVTTTGTLSLRRFWARRMRRLLPASLLVLAVSAAATVLFLPATLWAMTARQIAASAAYFENWLLANDAVDYMAQDNVPTVAQHYWSLSVEEQFYAFWPVLVLGLALLARRLPGGRRDQLGPLLVVGLTIIAVVSLAWSITATADDQARAYFVTPTRIWEFAAGALLAILAVDGVRLGAALRRLLSGAGLVAILVAAVLFDESSLFPGWIALLPVLGTVAVIAAGSDGTRLTPGWFLARRPMTFVGDISYSVYLWHWPLIIVLPFVTGADLRTADKLGILAGTIVLAWISKIAVEDPLRNRRFLSVMPSRTFAFASLGMLAVIASAIAIDHEVNDASAGSSSVLAESLSGAESAPDPGLSEQTFAAACVGPAALDPANDCSPVTGEGPPIAPPELVVKQNTDPDYPECQQSLRQATVIGCEIGATENPDRVVALVGDSHATHWFGALDWLGRERNWMVVTYTKASCPVTVARRVLPDEQGGEAADSCDTWVEGVRERIAGDDRISAVFTSAFSSAYEFEAGGRDLPEPAVQGFQAVWREWTESGREVFVLKDVPPTQGDNVPNCLAVHADDPLECATSADDLPDDAIAAAAEDAGDGVHLIDLTDQFCDDEHCYPLIGDVIVYRDFSHLSREYSRALSPYIAAQVDAAETATRGR